MAVLPYSVKIMPDLNRHPKPPSPLVVALAYDGLCTFEFGVAVEAFGLPRPEMGADWYRFAVAGVDPGEMRAAGGVRIVADGGLDLLAEAGTIIVPGWRGVDAPVPDALCEALAAAHGRGARILSICSGVFALAAAGLLAGRRATTHWRYTDALKQRYPDIHVQPDVLYVDEGTVLTSAGSAAGIDLCLHLIRRDYGMVAANMVARRLVVPPHRDGGQAQYIERAVPLPHESARLGPLLDHIRNNLGADHSVASLANISGMSTRTFLRRFEAATGTTPAQWVLLERLTRARDLLENSATPIDRIAELAGFGAAATLRHHFRRHYATTPTAYRETFAGPAIAEAG
ncbi:AraC family transcriptional activator FtrA [Pararhizobium capsulatum DSM 1112]|uniref:AraC family transcriptional activator FtrA n=1 Tax=Pararhizobium capsulatum DSM 1112 TaxID=1121113 RepID=A0ABU0BLD1_9HYPH|nr:transcriptional regulator FtrA [Pararhizobium capsulatum]MDQ0318827.1 AraC family transcriptional activator FtrA [Pararhizobium capsulatum DSM 1112]